MRAEQPVMQIQNGGFVSVRSETEARNYPVAPGNSVTFKDEISPYIYTKTMGFSQLDRPIFEKYKLIKEDASVSTSETQEQGSMSKDDKTTVDNLKSDIGQIRADVSKIWSEIDALKATRADDVGV